MKSDGDHILDEDAVINGKVGEDPREREQKRKERILASSRPQAPERAPERNLTRPKPPEAQTARDRVIAALTGGQGLPPDRERVMLAIGEALNLSPDDPFWVVLIPAITGGNQQQDVREMVAMIQNSLSDSRFTDFSETAEKILKEIRIAFTTKIENAVSSAVMGSFAESEFGVFKSLLKETLHAIKESQSFQPKPAPAPESEKKKSEGWNASGLVRYSVVAITSIAIGFGIGVLFNKSLYDKYIYTLEAKVQAYERINKK